jgi:hypothetical protein
MSMFRVENVQKTTESGPRKRGREIEQASKLVDFTSRDPETVIPMQESGQF